MSSLLRLLSLGAALSGPAALSAPDAAAVVPVQNETAVTSFSIAPSPQRAAQIAAVRAAFTYGPDIIAGEDGPYYPTGVLGNASDALDVATLLSTLQPWTEECDAVAAAAAEAVLAAWDGAPRPAAVADYGAFYDDGGWAADLGLRPFAGARENGSDDALFAMARLSTSPYAVRRLAPDAELAFAVDDDAAANLTGGTMTQQDLASAGRLFYVDYRALGELDLIEGRYAAACDAFFFQHPADDAFLPLAVRLGVNTTSSTNTSSSSSYPTSPSAGLIYTPLDAPLAWSLAKLAFSQNDLVYSALDHLAATHEVIDIVYAAAVRSLAPAHPVHGFLTRLAYQTWAIRAAFAEFLVNPGGLFDKNFAWGGAAAAKFSGVRYRGGAGEFRANYFEADLKSRGLLVGEGVEGPELVHFPYYEDASIIYNAIHNFTTAFVSAYYPTAADLAADAELQAWVTEANTAALVLDFPPSLSTPAELADALTHVAYLASIRHGASNGNELFGALVMPDYVAALYAPLPTTKEGAPASEADLVAFLPNVTQAAAGMALTAIFSLTRQQEGDDVSLISMFNGSDFLPKTPAPVRAAAAEFEGKMADFGAEVGARTFDARGLSQGMPMVWRALNPLSTPFYAAI